ncbi:MAG: hypothetical protein AAF583_12350 [Pseudomonadota bacterium]
MPTVEASVTTERHVARGDHQPVNIGDMFEPVGYSAGDRARHQSALFVLGGDEIAFADFFDWFLAAIPHGDLGACQEAAT